MKQIICFLICFIITLTFFGCNTDTSLLSSGNYYAVGDYEEWMTPYLCLDTNENEFSFSEGSIISYADYGTYTIIEGKIIAVSQNTIFKFEIKDNKTLILTDVEDNGHLQIPNGTQFIFSEDLK